MNLPQLFNLTLLIISLFVLSCTDPSTPEHRDQQKPSIPESSSFEISTSIEDDLLILNCSQGCAWEKLSFTLKEGNEPEFVNEYGMTDVDETKSSEEALADFLLSFQRNQNKIECTSQHGTSWTTLSFSCTPTNCNVKIDYSGVEM